MIIIDYGGRAPDPEAPNGGAVQSWDTATLTHHDYATGLDRPFDAAETVRFAAQIQADRDAQILAQIAAGIEDLQGALTVAQSDIADATTRAGQATAFAGAARTQKTAVTAWSPTAAGATDLATLRTRTVADLTTVLGAVADVLDRIATIGDALGELYAARALHSRGIALAFSDLIGLAQLAAREIRES